MKAEDVRRWLGGRRAAAERERREAATAPLPGEAGIARALALIALAGRLHGWPLPEDERSRREDRQAYDAWARLRRARPVHGPAR